MRHKNAVADMCVSLMILLIGKEQAVKTSVKLQPGLLLLQQSKPLLPSFVEKIDWAIFTK